MKLSPSEIAYLVAWAGFTPDEQPTAIAVALAESGGDCEVIARSTIGENLGQRDHGLWQISNRWNGQRLIDLGPWRNPWRNTAMAYDLFEEWGRTWGAWKAYTSGSYEVFLPDAVIALVHPFPPPQRRPTRAARTADEPEPR